MANWTTPIIWPDKPTPITIKHLNLYSDDLNFLKTYLEALKLSSQTFTSAPVIRDASILSGNVWTIGIPYFTGKIQVFVDGLLQRKNVDWSESANPSTGQFVFTTNPTPGSIIQVLDWTR